MSPHDQNELTCKPRRVGAHAWLGAILCGLLPVTALAGPLAQGASPCSDYIALVDGNWQHPLNALNFHGYVSWALGYVSAQAAPPAGLTDQETLKLALVDYCREHPDASFAAAVAHLVKGP